jgi:Helix-turn-helix domain
MKKEVSLRLKTPVIDIFPDGRMDGRNAAHYLGVKEKTMAMWRAGGTGPQFIKRGRIYYYKEDLDAWLNENGRHRSTAQALQPAGERR